MDRLAAMSLLIAVAETGNLSAASRRLGIPLSTVHRRIGDLETYLGSRLLHRTTRHTRLTDTGAAYVAACRGILEQVDDAERAVRGEYAVPRGEIVMTAPIVFGRLHVVPLIAEFMARYPDIDIRLLLVDRLVHLMEEHVDIALRIGELADSSMVALPVVLEETRVTPPKTPAVLPAAQRFAGTSTAVLTAPSRCRASPRPQGF